jgi:hypothetical protein
VSFLAKMFSLGKADAKFEAKSVTGATVLMGGLQHETIYTGALFTVSTANGDFLRNTVGFSATTGVSNYPIRINVAPATVPSNPTGQHNCPNGQAVTAYVGPGTAITPPMRVYVCPREQDRLLSPA